MPAATPFLRHLLRNLRITFFLVVLAVGLVILYALVSGEKAEWEIVIFLAIGMTLSSLINAGIEARREGRG